MLVFIFFSIPAFPTLNLEKKGYAGDYLGECYWGYEEGYSEFRL